VCSSRSLPSPWWSQARIENKNNAKSLGEQNFRDQSPLQSPFAATSGDRPGFCSNTRCHSCNNQIVKDRPRVRSPLESVSRSVGGQRLNPHSGEVGHRPREGPGSLPPIATEFRRQDNRPPVFLGQPNRKQAILLILLPPSSASKPVTSKPGRKQFYVGGWLTVRQPPGFGFGPFSATKPSLPLHRTFAILSSLAAFARALAQSPFFSHKTASWATSVRALFHRPRANKKRRKRGAFFESFFNRQLAANYLSRPRKSNGPVSSTDH
jgi:hypothetical protein